jgi:hypothetical protein
VYQSQLSSPARFERPFGRSQAICAWGYFHLPSKKFHFFRTPYGPYGSKDFESDCYGDVAAALAASARRLDSIISAARFSGENL